MQLDWTTFLLEILNFLVLVWILKRFLYRPILDIIERRRASIAESLARAQAREDDAEAAEERYLAMARQAESDRESARARLDEEIAAERSRRLKEVDQAVKAARTKSDALEARRAEGLERAAESQARKLAGAFAARLLERLAGSALDGEIVRVAMDELRELPGERLEVLRAAAHQPGASLLVASARPLADGDRAMLDHALQAALGARLVPVYESSPELLSGLRITLGPWQLEANLRDALSFFAEGPKRVD